MTPFKTVLLVAGLALLALSPLLVRDAGDVRSVDDVDPAAAPVDRRQTSTQTLNPTKPMTKTILDVGNCGPDFNAIRQMVSSQFSASIVQAHGTEDAIELLKEKDIDLVTINRKLDRDYSDGMDVLKAIKADPEIADIPVMIVTNYEEHQQSAMQAGAVQGFGKLALDAPETKALLEPYLAAE